MTDWLHAFDEGYPTAEELEGSVTINDDGTTPEDRAAIERFRADTPGTPLTPMAEWIDRQSNTPWSPGYSEDFRTGYDTAVEEASAAYEAETIALRRERRERVDPDLLAKAMHESDFHARYHGDVDENDRIMARDLAERYNRLAATPDHTVGGEEREAQIEAEARRRFLDHRGIEHVADFDLAMYHLRLARVADRATPRPR